MSGSDESNLLKKLGEVTREIDATLRTVLTMEGPVADTASILPQASSHLSDVTALTEQGTHRVMALTEAMQDNRAAIVKALDELVHGTASGGTNGEVTSHLRAIQDLVAQDEGRLLDIMTALAFQDLVGQRIKKVTGILADVEHRLLETLIVFGGNRGAAAKQPDSRANVLLKELEASKTTAIKQDLVDEILGQAGLT
jgi:chemotaxis protein CheZ